MKHIREHYSCLPKAPPPSFQSFAVLSFLVGVTLALSGKLSHDMFKPFREIPSI